MAATTTSLGKVVNEIRNWVGGADRRADAELVHRFVASQDEAAFACLVQRHGPLVLGLCRKLLRQEQDAEDAFQATFLILARRARAIRKQESVGGWLYAVAFRVAHKLRATRARRLAREQPLPDDIAAHGTEDWTWQDVQAAVYAELDRLADKYRAPLLLCYVQGKTRDEAAQQLGWQLGVLRGRLDRGRELLRSRLLRRGLSLSAAPLVLGLGASSTGAALVPALLVSSTITAALGAARTTAAAGVVSAEVAALTEGVLRAMFLNKCKFLAVALVTLAVVGAGAGLISYPTSAQPVGPAARTTAPPVRASAQAAGQETDLNKLKQEIGRLRDELRRTQRELERAKEEIAALKLQAEVEKLRAENERERALRRAAVKALEEIRLKPANQKKEQNLVPLQEPKAVSPDGRRLAVARDSSLVLLDAETRKELARSQAHKLPITTIAFSPDGKVLASGSQDATVVMVDVATLRQIRMFGVPSPVRRVQFSGDGRTLFILQNNGTQHDFDFATGKLISVVAGERPSR
jgi:RNA polymerase sigma factor (sigma-70 family)